MAIEGHDSKDGYKSAGKYKVPRWTREYREKEFKTAERNDRREKGVATWLGVIESSATSSVGVPLSGGRVGDHRWGGKKEFSRRSRPTKVTVGVKDDAPPLVPSYQGLLEGDSGGSVSASLELERLLVFTPDSLSFRA
ncbi:hypothetical protein HZH68_001481 [Vespula germanica]|uniref:Uncharacterized protein n=1 Tax=Vespula germanica TaxID=30212 RepID=A0A834NVL7_VESGE|nr:hypothetical protein HZH68_001481 [Vespula germanica]